MGMVRRVADMVRYVVDTTALPRHPERSEGPWQPFPGRRSGRPAKARRSLASLGMTRGANSMISKAGG